MSEPKKFAFSGGIGAGKSTAVEICGKLTGAITYGEPALDNSYLEDYCADPHRWAAEFQMYILSERERIQREATKQERYFQDRCYQEDVVFAKANHRMGYMDERAFKKTYWPHFESVSQNMDNPDVIVYFDISADEVMRRIRMRGRECEQSYQMDYLRILGREYETWVPQVAAKVPMFKIGARDIYVEQGSNGEKEKKITKNIKRVLEAVREKYADERPKNGLFELQI